MLNSPWKIVFLAGFIVYIAIRHVYAERVKGQEKVVRRVDRLEKTLLAVVLPGSLLLPVLYLFTPLLKFADYQLPVLVPWFGTITMVAALWLFWRSHADLGPNWSISLELRREHELIQSGVYRSVRHPMYASILLFDIAQGLMLENWIGGWSALVTFAPLYFVRTPREERMMIERFGDEYQEYMAVTGRILPRVGISRT